MVQGGKASIPKFVYDKARDQRDTDILTCDTNVQLANFKV